MRGAITSRCMCASVYMASVTAHTVCVVWVSGNVTMLLADVNPLWPPWNAVPTFRYLWISRFLYIYVQTPELNSESGDWLTNHLIRWVGESPDPLHCFFVVLVKVLVERESGD